jgi:hypothetical protein
MNIRKSPGICLKYKNFDISQRRGFPASTCTRSEMRDRLDEARDGEKSGGAFIFSEPMRLAVAWAEHVPDANSAGR